MSVLRFQDASLGEEERYGGDYQGENGFCDGKMIFFFFRKITLRKERRAFLKENVFQDIEQDALFDLSEAIQPRVVFDKGEGEGPGEEEKENMLEIPNIHLALGLKEEELVEKRGDKEGKKEERGEGRKEGKKEKKGAKR